MSYLLDRKIKKKKLIRFSIFIIVLFFIFYFHTGILNKLSYVSHFVFRPIVKLGNNIGDNFKSAGSYFYSKRALLAENEDLKTKLSEQGAEMANYKSILDENQKLKEILGRSITENQIIVSAILSKPNFSPYDTLLIDVGLQEGVTTGDRIFAFGNIPIGRVAEVYKNSSKVVLYSSPGEKTEIIISGGDILMQIVGRGGGNFEMILPRDFILTKSAEVHLPGINPYVVAVVETVISDPRDAFTKALLVSPVNIQELKFVQVVK
jgi:cell shape-determining protein MreC